MLATYAKLFVTMLIWGGTWVAGRYAVLEAPPLAIAVWRFLLASGALLALVAWRHGGLPRPTRAEWRLTAGLGLTGIFLYNLCFLYGLQRLAAGHAALVDRPAALVPDYSPLVWSCILFLALLGTTLGFTWFNQAVARLGAARASVFINLVPVAAVLQGAWLLDERLGVPVLVGGALVLAGVMLTQQQPVPPIVTEPTR